MNVVYLLKNKLRTVEFLRLVILTPELICCITTVFTPFLFKNLQHPIFTAFVFIIDYRFNDLFAGKLFEISENITQVFILSRYNKMQMIAHKAPTMQCQPLF